MTVLGAAVSVTAAAALVFGAWRAPASDPVPLAPAVAGNEIGNERPAVISYDGPMIRRCTAIAVFPRTRGTGPAIQAALRARSSVALTELPPGVLSAATLEQEVPEVVDCVPYAADPGRLLATPLPGEDHHRVESVLVHDLVFTVTPHARTPAATAVALDREGILADSLGRYQVRIAGSALRILYTGPLLGDDEIATVRTGIARQSGTTTVTVTPRSPTGPGVIIADEPPPPSAADEDHPHG